MAQRQTAPRPEAFFLDAAPDKRFCLFYPPAGSCRGALLYVAPFGEEMNKSRRMAALQARELAAQGFGVLLLDLYGCGDSSGDFNDARWDIWKHDVALAWHWLHTRLGHPVSLWGLRLGALLALDVASNAASNKTLPIASIVLWQPVHSGAAFLTQFLRLRIASEMLSEEQEKSGGTRALRDALRAGASLEVAGYELAPALAASIDALDAAALLVPACTVHWFDMVAAEGRPLSPAAQKITAAWQAGGVDLQVHLVPGTPFWASQEVSECPALLAATCAALTATVLAGAA